MKVMTKGIKTQVAPHKNNIASYYKQRHAKIVSVKFSNTATDLHQTQLVQTNNVVQSTK